MNYGVYVGGVCYYGVFGVCCDENKRWTCGSTKLYNKGRVLDSEAYEYDSISPLHNRGKFYIKAISTQLGGTETNKIMVFGVLASLSSLVFRYPITHHTWPKYLMFYEHYTITMSLQKP